MTVQEVEALLRAHIDSDPIKTSAHYWPAEEALEARVPGVSSELIIEFYKKVQSVWPEVGPKLDSRDDATLRAWAQAAFTSPREHWNSILLKYWNNEPERLRYCFSLLCKLYKAPASPEPIKLPSDDQDLVEALRAQLGVEARGNYPLGWAAVVLAEGSPESVRAVETHIVDPVESPLLTCDLDDLRRLVPNPTTPEAKTLMEKVNIRLEERDRVNGHDAFFQSLGISNPPATFDFLAHLPGKGGHKATFAISRDWRTSIAEWNFGAGKARPRFQISSRTLLNNGLGLDYYPLDRLEDALRDTAAALKTQWVGPWEAVIEKGFESSILPLLDERFRGVLAPPKKSAGGAKKPGAF